MVRKTPLSARLKHKITVQQVTEVQDAYGEPIETFTTFAMRKAKVVTGAATEKYTGFQEQNSYKVVFIVRYDSTTKMINEKMRISYNAKIYDIESAVDPFEMHKEIHISGHHRGT